MRDKYAKYLIAILLIGTTFLFTGCNSDKKEEDWVLNKSTESKSSNENSNYKSEKADEVREMGHVEIDIENGPVQRFMTIPMYIQQDYDDVLFGNSTIAKEGNLVTCLSMLDSYYSASYNNPEVFMNKYAEYFNENGITDESSLIYKVGENAHLKVVGEPLDINKLSKYLTTDMAPVMIKIPHPSIYGKYSSCMIITGTTSNGDFIMRDPDANNITDKTERTEKGETIYSSFDFIVEAGSSAVMYPFYEVIPIESDEVDENIDLKGEIVNIED